MDIKVLVQGGDPGQIDTLCVHIANQDDAKPFIIIGQDKIPEATKLNGVEWKEELEATFGPEADALEKILHDHLPGGTYDRLLGAMLRREAGYFIVSRSH